MYWDESIGKDGNKYWRILQEPSLGRLLGDRLRDPALGGKVKALDLATGNGLCARWLAAQGADVLATDGSENMLERVRAYVAAAGEDSENKGRIIAVRKLDVTSPADFEALVEEQKSSVSTKALSPAFYNRK